MMREIRIHLLLNNRVSAITGYAASALRCWLIPKQLWARQGPLAAALPRRYGDPTGLIELKGFADPS
jgi:hypothetical protein